MAEKQLTHDEAVKKLGELIKGIDIGMLTTREEDGTLRSRPMRVQEIEFDGDLWFLTKADSGKVHEIEINPQVCVSFARPDKQNYVSVSGDAELCATARRLMNSGNPFTNRFSRKAKTIPI